ncbi:MAG: hypothetical protein ACLFWM_01405 [Actinomycetota bacterium]
MTHNESCQVPGCHAPSPQYVVERRESLRLVCHPCMAEMVSLFGWEPAGLLGRMDEPPPQFENGRGVAVR